MQATKQPQPQPPLKVSEVTQPADATNRTSLVTFLVLMLGTLGAFLYLVAPFTLAVFMGGVLALLSYPLYRRLVQRMHFKAPRLAAFAVTLGLFVLVIAP